MIVPAFLTENLFFFINIGMKNGIHIDIHQVCKIFVIAACNRIHGLIRIGHRIQKGIERTFYQLHKRIFGRKLFASTQRTVFQNMCYPGAVYRRCTKCNMKYFIIVIICNDHDACTAFSVTQQIAD